ncbi:patatin-like phospholipase family protein [Pseudomaricurvus alkylphenolicus]|jgi:NTE family protein|uniref:patatin-like phospholipase family protein n=1 Tax=Pseudomaricurvus alkylphenolicus TaxID=1306991 RepID=UPI00141FEA08|nr:patatin-like phospholipase family protein [Pseudomaricurvus alkylphenolicus]NIB44936.1 patatin-like phospholipase family protein [Pseudomaricurvus alkylphenolicus]
MATNALILSGGGARAAYQVGVLSAINELLPSSTHNPFPIICGTSAGAINAIALATHTGHYYEAVADLNDIWTQLSTERVFRTSWGDLISGGARLLMSLLREGIGKHKSIALLDNAPLREFLAEHIDFSQLQVGLNNRDLKAVAITAMNYGTGESVSFYQGNEELKDWRRYRRIGIATQLTLDHLMASAAIPGIFPAVKVNRDYFADGALRQMAPISPALHMGADRIFVIGVSGNRNPVHWAKRAMPPKHSPSIAQVFGHLFNSAFIDSLEGDIEHLERVNELLELIPEETLEENNVRLRSVETMVISPSKELDKIAGRKIRYMPKSVRVFLRSAGGTTKGGGAATSSYLLFEKPFIDELIELGYQDTMWEKDRIQAFFEV